MVVFTPSVQPVGVGSGGEVFEIAIDKGFHVYDIVLIEAEHVSGSATHTLVEFSTDSTFVNPGSRVATFEGLNNNSPVGHTNFKRFYTWDESEAAGSVFVRLTPDTEIDNDYVVRLHLVGDTQ